MSHPWFESIEKAYPTKYITCFIYRKMDNYASSCSRIVVYFPTPCYLLEENKEYTLTEGSITRYKVANKWDAQSTNQIYEIDYQNDPLQAIYENTRTELNLFNTYQEAKEFALKHNEEVIKNAKIWFSYPLEDFTFEKVEQLGNYISKVKKIQKEIMESADKLYETTINKEHNEPTK